MKIELTKKEFRRLLDMVYIGNWILNSARGDDRFEDYDHIESLIFSYCAEAGMDALYKRYFDAILPSHAFEEGGIHEAISDYEDAVFFENLAEELASRDMGFEPVTLQNISELDTRITDYLSEFNDNGIENLVLEK